MKKTDLMCGDLVLVQGIPTEVTDIDGLDGINREWIAGCEDGGCIRWEHVEPMPLTEEVLVKSGFPRDLYEENKSYWDDEDKDKYRLYKFNAKYPNFHLIEVILPDEHYFWVEDHCTIKIHYVHEFQHLLKLCGIEKEIVV